MPPFFSFFKKGILSVFILALLFSNAAMAQNIDQPSRPAENSAPLKVGVYVSPPFIIKDGQHFTGMAIDLWEHIAQKLGKPTTYQEFQTYSSILRATADGDIDVAVTNLSITEKRALEVDFTHPWYDSGLQIMVHSEAGTGFSNLFEELGDAGYLASYAWIAVVILMTTIVFTIVDRKYDRNFPTRWHEGFAENFYHVMSITTSGKSMRKNLFGWMGKIWQALWMVCGVAVIAYVTSSVTSVMTVAHINSQIFGISDLHGKTVGVRTGSMSESYLQARSIATVAFDHLEEATDALIEDEIAAIVSDGPVLEYYLHQHPKKPLRMVGAPFSPDKFGFAVTPGNDYRKPISTAIIGAYENGTLERIKQNYFGFKP